MTGTAGFSRARRRYRRYIRTHKLSVRCTRDIVVIVGLPARKKTETATEPSRPAPSEQLAPAGHDTSHDLAEHGRPLGKRHSKAALRFRGETPPDKTGNGR